MGLDITGRHASGVELHDAFIKATELFLAFIDELRHYGHAAFQAQCRRE
ncbi:hypothetical protein SOHN41_00248 [Shewanella sp. HN-41]|nr:hypothetical protein SOHN41_00248 [Shewanella sp. HN-41]